HYVYVATLSYHHYIYVSLTYPIYVALHSFPTRRSSDLCTRRRMPILSRSSAARSNSRRMAAPSISLVNSAARTLLRPSRNITECRTSSAYSSGVTRPTQGPLARLIWYCRQGRVRLRTWRSAH